MKSPEIYAEWIDCLKALKKGENKEEVLSVMEQGTLAEEVSVRFVNRAVDLVGEWLYHSQDVLSKRMQQNGTEGGLVQALLAERQQLHLMTRLLTLPALPQNLRDNYAKSMQKQADDIQKNLEDSAKSDRTGKLASLVRQTPVNTGLFPAPEPEPEDDQEEAVAPNAAENKEDAKEAEQ